MNIPTTCGDNTFSHNTANERAARQIVQIALDAQDGSAADAIPLVEDHASANDPVVARALEILEGMVEQQEWEARGI